MSTAKIIPNIGDRVMVNAEGIIATKPNAWGMYRIDLDNARSDHARFTWAAVEHLEVLAPPVKVGDKVTAQNIGRLPLSSVVAAPSSTVYERWSNVGIGSDWCGTNGEKTDDVFGFTILRIGGGTS